MVIFSFKKRQAAVGPAVYHSHVGCAQALAVEGTDLGNVLFEILITHKIF
jgi:hypothetical protein